VKQPLVINRTVHRSHPNPHDHRHLLHPTHPSPRDHWTSLPEGAPSAKTIGVCCTLRAQIAGDQPYEHRQRR
jgi:hypothetical protein